MHAYRDQYAQLFHAGRNVVLLAVSVDAADTLAAWAHDDEFPFLFASDSGSVVGKQYGAVLPRYGLDSRALYVIGPDGRIAWRTPDFKEIDPTAYTELAAVINRVAGPDSTHTQ
jgi:peroxiredoxin